MWLLLILSYHVFTDLGQTLPVQWTGYGCCLYLSIGHPRSILGQWAPTNTISSTAHLIILRGYSKLRNPSSHILVGLTKGAPIVVYFQSGTYPTETHDQTFLFAGCLPARLPFAQSKYCQHVAILWQQRATTKNVAPLPMMLWDTVIKISFS